MTQLLPLTAFAQAVGRQVVPAHLAAAIRGLQPVGRYAGTNQLNLAIGLPLRHPEELTTLLRQINDPASANYRHYLTPGQFTERFGPTEKDYQAVLAFAKANGLRVTATHGYRMVVDVNASVTDIEKAMHMRMQVFEHPTEKRLFHAPDAEPTLDLAVPVLGISGLDDYSLPRPALRARPSSGGQIVSTNLGSGPGGASVNAPFSVTIQKQNPTNGVITNYTGLVLLDSTNGVAVSPARSGDFVQGSWTGAVVISQAATNLVLRASDGLEDFGLANPIDVVVLPTLDLRSSANTLQFLWPIGYSGFVLEESGRLSPATWTTVPVSPVQVGDQYFVPLQISSTNCFYRLIRPEP